jgi:hypothetical protein
MVSRSRRIFAQIAKEMSGLVLCRDMLVIPPTEHIVRGFLVENRSTKDSIYLWKVVCPLHRPMQDVYLNYGDRISNNGGDNNVDPKDFKKSAALIGSIIGKHVNDLATVRTPKDFLRHIDRMLGNESSVVRLDLALTYCRLGNIRKCRDVLAKLRVRFDSRTEQMNQGSRQKHPDPFGDQLKLVESALESGRGNLLALMNEWERKNVELLELGPTRVPPVGRRNRAGYALGSK